MKILFVCSGNSIGKLSFIKEQADSLIKLGVETDFFLIKGKGFRGYMKNLPNLKEKIKSGKYDLVHAHYGLSGALAVMQRLCPVFVTFQGDDVNRFDYRIISKIVMKFSCHNIFVSRNLFRKADVRTPHSIIPYGVDLRDKFIPMDKRECRKKMSLEENDKIALFSSSPDRIEKNYPLAEKAVEKAGNVKLLNLQKGYTQNEICLLLNACDFLILTSLREGCPVIVLEAMACNCPVISTDVGNVRDVISDTKGCYITSFDPDDIAENIEFILDWRGRTDGRNKIQKFDIEEIAKNILSTYRTVLNKNGE